MSLAEKVARNLAAWFLSQGQYAASGAMPGAREGFVPAAARMPQLDDQFEQRDDMSALAIQAVGHEVGVERPKVHVYYSGRGSRKALAAIPTAQGDVPIQINKIGALQIRPESSGSVGLPGSVYQRGVRIACGSSCAPAGESYAGTLGAVVKRTGEDQLYLLSNNHIFGACNHTPVGMPIMAPSMLDAGPQKPAPMEVARHELIETLLSGEPNLVKPCREDVALAKVVDPSRISSWQGDATGYDTPSAAVAPLSGMAVKKFGRTTGLTTGVIEAVIKSPTPLMYKTRLFTGQVWFQDIWTVTGDNGEPFALQGDSGSLVVTADGNSAVGLVFASDDSYGFIIPMTGVLKCFGGIELVGRHGVER